MELSSGFPGTRESSQWLAEIPDLPKEEPLTAPTPVMLPGPLVGGVTSAT